MEEDEDDDEVDGGGDVDIWIQLDAHGCIFLRS